MPYSHGPYSPASPAIVWSSASSEYRRVVNIGDDDPAPGG
jgi:hypothetical protein